MRLITKRRAFFALTTALLVVFVGGAYAFFTTTGTGTGTAAVGSSSAVTLHATVTGNLYPGTSSPVSFTVDNPSSGKQRVGTISLQAITPDASHSECSTVISGGNPDFTMARRGRQPDLRQRQRPGRDGGRHADDERNRREPGQMPGRDPDAERSKATSPRDAG